MVRPQYVCLGDDVTIGRNTDIFVHPEDPNSKECIIQIGNNVHIGTDNIIGARKKILEDNVLLAAHVMIADHSHHYENIDIPINSRPPPRLGLSGLSEIAGLVRTFLFCLM